MKKLLGLTLGILLLLSAPHASAADVGDPSEVSLKIETMWVSFNADCSDAEMVFRDANAVYQDMTQNPVFGSATVTNGTYECLVFKMSDRIEGRSAFNSDSGNCTIGMPIILDIFRGGNSTCPDGSTVTGTALEDRPCVYFSTSGVSQGDAYEPEAALPLGSPYVVANDRNATIVTDFNGKVRDTGNACDIDPPDFSFR